MQVIVFPEAQALLGPFHTSSSHRKGLTCPSEMPFLNLFPWEHTIMNLTAKAQHWMLILWPPTKKRSP